MLNASPTAITVALLLGVPLPVEVEGTAKKPFLVETTRRSFQIPFFAKQDTSSVKSAVLVVSTDAGKHWKEYAEANPAEMNHFSFDAPNPGTYWFALKTVHQNGSISFSGKPVLCVRVLPRP